MNLISNLTNSCNPAIAYLQQNSMQNAITKPYNVASQVVTLPQTISQPAGVANSGNFIQNFVSQMMCLAQTFMQNMFALVGLSVQGGNTNGIQGTTGLEGLLGGGTTNQAQGGSSLGNIFSNLLGGIFNSGSDSSSGSFLSNIWSVAKNLFSGLFRGSNSTDGASGSSGNFLSNLWSGVKDIFGGLLGGSSSSASGTSSSSGSFFSNLWGGVKDIFGGLFGGSSSSSSGILSGCGSFFSNLWDGAKDMFGGLFSSIF